MNDEHTLASVLSRCSNVVAIKSKGSYIWDVDGKRYLDFTSSITANSTGHIY